jgi:hypothetical protein
MAVMYIICCNVDGCAIVVNCITALSARYCCPRRFSMGFYGLRAGREKLTGWQWTWYCTMLLRANGVWTQCYCYFLVAPG